MRTFFTTENKTLHRVSCWIKIQHNYNVNKRNNLYYYATDENGYRDGQAGFNPSNGLTLDYFRFNGRNYAIEQFLAMGTMFNPSVITFTDEHGKLSHIAGYDSENYYNPLMIELSECGEYVRCYYEQ